MVKEREIFSPIQQVENLQKSIVIEENQERSSLLNDGDMHQPEQMVMIDNLAEQYMKLLEGDQPKQAEELVQPVDLLKQSVFEEIPVQEEQQQVAEEPIVE